MTYLLTFFAFFIAVQFVLLAFRLRSIRLNASPQLLSIDRSRLPDKVGEFFDSVTTQLRAEGFEPVRIMMHPRSLRGGTSYLLFLESAYSSDRCLSIVTRQRAPLHQLQGFITQFETRIDDRSQIVTDNMAGIRILAATPTTSHMRVPAWEEAARLYRLHRHHVKTHLAASSRSLECSTAERISYENDYLESVEFNAKAGVLALSADGLWYEFTRSHVLLLMLQLSFPVAVLLRWKLARQARACLRAAGMPATIPLQAQNKTIRLRHEHAKENQRDYLVLVLPIGSVLAALLLQASPRGSLGWIRFDLLMIAFAILYLVSKRKSVIRTLACYCPACGHDRKDCVRCEMCSEAKCWKCGYNLFANRTGRCPECGSTYCTKCERAIVGIESRDCTCEQPPTAKGILNEV